MKTEIHLVGGEMAEFDSDAIVRMNEHGVEITSGEGEDQVKVLFPWARIEKVLQRGVGLGSVYTY